MDIVKSSELRKELILHRNRVLKPKTKEKQLKFEFNNTNYTISCVDNHRDHLYPIGYVIIIENLRNVQTLMDNEVSNGKILRLRFTEEDSL